MEGCHRAGSRAAAGRGGRLIHADNHPDTPTRIYARPDDTVKFMVSCETPITYRADLVRIVCGDDNPEGPGYKEEEIASAINGDYQGRKQHIHAGSYVTVPDSRALRGLESFTVQAFIWPTTPTKGKQALVSKWSAADKSGFALVIDETGSVALEIGDGGGAVARVSVGKELQLRRWYRVGAAYDAAAGVVRVFQIPLLAVPDIADGAATNRRSPFAWRRTGQPSSSPRWPERSRPVSTSITTARSTARLSPRAR